MSEINKIKEKLRKLIAKEESARELGNLAEAEAFASKIQQLLMEYELSIEELKANTAESTAMGIEIFDLKPLLSRHESDWIEKLYSVASRLNFCMAIFSSKTTELKLVGTEMNREFTHYLAGQLIPKLRTLAHKSFSEYNGPEKRNTYIRGFLRGAVMGIRERLLGDLEKMKKENTQVQGLVLMKDRALKEFIQKEFPHLSSRNSNRLGGKEGAYQGYVAGKNVPINQGLNRGMGGTKLLS